MQSINLIMFTETAQSHTTNPMQSINLILFTVTAQPQTTKAHALN